MRHILTIFCFVSIIPLNAQKEFLARVDSTYIENSYAEDSSLLQNILANPLTEDKFIPADYDQDFLSAAVCCYINQTRRKKRKPPLRFSKELHTLCYDFLDYFSLRSFETDFNKNERYNKIARKSVKKIRYPKGIIKTIIFRLNAIQYSGGEYYYDEEDSATELKLFYGKKPSANRNKEEEIITGFKKNPVEVYTYHSIIELIYKKYIHAKYSKVILSADYSSIGCYLMVDKKTIGESRIPQVSCMCILSAERLQDISSADKASKKQKKLIK